MKLKFKPMSVGSGRPIAFLNGNFAKKSGIPQGSRIEIIHNKNKIVMVVNLVNEILKENEISFSQEALPYLKIKTGDQLTIIPALEPESSRFILKKLNKKELSQNEIFAIVKDIVGNFLTEPEIAYFVSGVYNNGMTLKEIVYLTEAMAQTGTRINWGNKKIVDKHSIGGVPNNRTTPIIVSICAAAGIIMPKTSSKAITGAAGTADVMATITNVNLSEKRIIEVVNKTNACLVWGGSLGLAPADDKLIRIEHLLNVDPEPQLLASILAKKMSVGSKSVLIDIPYGPGAKVSFEEAKELKKKFIYVGKKIKLKIKVLLTDGSQPIGNGIGPILEILDVLKILNRTDPPKDLEKKSVYLAGQILEMAGKAKNGNGIKIAREILDSGKALVKFNEIITAQGKKENVLVPAKYRHEIKSDKSEKIKAIHNKEISYLAKILGCPASQSSGIYLHKHVGNKVEKGQVLLTLYSDSKRKLEAGIKFLVNTKPISF